MEVQVTQTGLIVLQWVLYAVSILVGTGFIYKAVEYLRRGVVSDATVDCFVLAVTLPTAMILNHFIK